MDKKTEEEIIRWLELSEEYHSGMRNINGGCVNIEDVEIIEDEDLISCTVELCWQMEGRTERYTNCEYKLSEVLKLCFPKEPKEKVEFT